MNGVDDRAVRVFVLAAAAVGGLYVALTGSPLVGGGLALACGWFALDVLCDLHHGVERPVEPSKSELDEMGCA